MHNYDMADQNQSFAEHLIASATGEWHDSIETPSPEHSSIFFSHLQENLGGPAMQYYIVYLQVNEKLYHSSCVVRIWYNIKS